jgi:recombination protein RecA
MAAKKKIATVTVNAPISREIDDRRKMADLIVSQIRTSYGQGSIMKMNEVLGQDVDVVSTGSISIDLATGVGGFPRGRIIEIYGPESSGKTSLALSTIAQAQKKSGLAAFIDAEHALDPEWAIKLGVNLTDLYVSQPSNGEEALEIVDNLVRSNAFDVIVIDSVAALVPRSEIEGNMGDAQMGVQARLMSQALRKLTGAISKSRTVVIFLNQIRMKIGVMFGNPETTTGGQALKFFSSIRLDIRKVGQLKSGTNIVGNRHRVKVVKNKMAAPFKQVEFDMMFDEPGVFSVAGEVLDTGLGYNIIEKVGNTYTVRVPSGNHKLGVGRDAAKKVLYDNQIWLEEARIRILEEFRKKLEHDRSSPVAPANSDEELGEHLEDVSTEVSSAAEEM